MNTIKNDVRRGLCSPYMALGVALCILLYALGHSRIEWLNILRWHNGEWVHYHNMYMTEFNPIRTLLPLAAVLPYCAATAEDWEHRGHYQAVTRCSFSAYCNGKFIAAALLGGLTLMAGLWTYLGVLAAHIEPFRESSYREAFIEPLLQNRQWALYFLYYGSLQFFLGMLCAGMGCVTAALTPRRGMIYLTPLLLLAMLEIVTNVTLVGLSGGQSSIVFRYKTQTPGAVWRLIAGILLPLTAACYALYRWLLRKRVYVWQ